MNSFKLYGCLVSAYSIYGVAVFSENATDSTLQGGPECMNPLYLTIQHKRYTHAHEGVGIYHLL